MESRYLQNLSLKEGHVVCYGGPVVLKHDYFSNECSVNMSNTYPPPQKKPTIIGMSILLDLSLKSFSNNALVTYKESFEDNIGNFMVICTCFKCISFFISILY